MTLRLSSCSLSLELLWEQAVPLQAASKDGVRVDTVEADQDMTVALDRTLIRLLATGLSEEAIAGYLNCHQRTARRRIREMMSRLDAHTRFQAGYQSARRGYLARDDPP